MSKPFYFYTSLTLIELLGKKARNLTELLDGIKTVPDSSICHHTHKFLQQHHYLSPEPPNDFAYWTTNVLQEVELGERLASIDIIQFTTIEELRAKFIEIIENYLKEGNLQRNSPEGADFYFMSSKMFVLPTAYVAHNLIQFKQVLEKISIHSLYFHMFEAKLRLEKGDNDFSRWLRDIGEAALAEEISKLDPYTCTLEGLRKRILCLIDGVL